MDFFELIEFFLVHQGLDIIMERSKDSKIEK